MLDNVLIPLVRNIIIAQETIAGIPGTPIKQAFQPTQQGVNTEPAAYFHIMGYRRVGFPYWGDAYDVDQSKMVHTELQQYETDFQISALATQDPATPTQYTAGDILNLIAHILQSNETVAAFAALSIGILRVRDVRNPYFTNDKDRFEASPSLDFTITNKQIVLKEVPVVQSAEFNEYAI